MPTTMRMMPMIPAGFTVPILQRSPPADQLQNQNHYGNDKEDMNVCPQNVEAHETEQPEDQQNYKDSPKHKNLSI